MKPRVFYADLRWEQAFARFRGLPEGTKLIAEDVDFAIDWVCDEPHPPSLWLKYRLDGKQRSYIVRRGDPLLMELRQC